MAPRSRRIATLAAAGLTFMVGGCGGSDEAPPAATATAQSNTAQPIDAAPFRVLANDVCATVSQAAPRPLAPTAGPDDVMRYARASVRVSRAMTQSLRRLPAPASMRPAVAGLARAWRDAQREYTSIERAHVTASAVSAVTTTLRARESAIVSQATAADIPACAGALGR